MVVNRINLSDISYIKYNLYAFIFLLPAFCLLLISPLTHALYDNFENPAFEMLRGKVLFQSTTADRLPAGELLKLRLSQLDEHLTAQYNSIKNPAMTAFYESVFGESSHYGMKSPEALVDLIAHESSTNSDTSIGQVSNIFEQLLIYLAPYIKPSLEDYSEIELTSGMCIKQHYDRIYDQMQKDEIVATINSDMNPPLAIISPESAAYLMKSPADVFFTKQSRSNKLPLGKEGFEGIAKLAIVLIADYLNVYKKQLESIPSSGNQWLEYEKVSANLHTVLSHYRTFFRDLIPYLPEDLANSEQIMKFSALLKEDIFAKRRDAYPDFEADYHFYTLSLAYLVKIGDLFNVSPAAFSHLTQLSFSPDSCYGCDTIGDYFAHQRSSHTKNEEDLKNAIHKAFNNKRLQNFAALRMIFNRMRAQTSQETNQLKSEWTGISDEIDGMRQIMVEMLNRLENMKPAIKSLNTRLQRVHEKYENTEQCLDNLESNQI